jgi:hypothetical protein
MGLYPKDDRLEPPASDAVASQVMARLDTYKYTYLLFAAPLSAWVHIETQAILNALRQVI